ncbi:three-Cys-motif partner protein TcmP [Fusobacterium necrophorum]|uniref:three-Cys-motif partner protein TcmP n=1 Tax=Fusobacterium necrophorum TaxID=859 RepID=UPI000788870A|nr:three-Cys-motif partner protein TcmP [Fusobacterium necrophorum]KYM48187.1 hypothetical protein A2U04_05530 [Fusobacterium necrophorum subsp. funduliforme]MDK4494989.1 three-Cys-motif partner protein TcmP [Fusobacterium necrophorum]
MSNFSQLLKDLEIPVTKLDPKKDQTNYKIKYVTEYVYLWLIVSCKRENIENINFIDSMSNAGIYQDGELGTSVEVFRLFQKFSKNNPQKTFNLFLNDKDDKRIEILKKIINHFSKNESNINVYFSNEDVNIYLNQNEFSAQLKYPASTVLFVDPYNFKDSNLNIIYNFANRYYCELFYNLFYNDILRNYVKDSKMIDIFIKSVENEFRENKYKKERFIFSYSFKNKKNTEIYRIMFITPNIRGIEKLKEALWNIFKGLPCYKNIENKNQLTMFREEKEVSLLEYAASEAREFLLDKFNKDTILVYDDIKKFLIQKTILKDGQFIKHVIKPLIKEKKIKKMGDVSNKDFKGDSYKIL